MPPWVPRAILLYFVGLAAFGTLAWLIGRLQTLLLDMFVALFLSFALEPVVNWLQNRGWRRGWATGASFIGLLVFTAVFLFAIGAVVFDQVNQFIDRAPEYAQDAADFVNDRFGANVSVEELQDELTREDGPVQSLATRLAGNALGVGASALGIIFRLLTIGLFTFYLVADGPRFRRTVCSFLPESRQHRVLETWEIAIDKTGGYLYSRALLALVSALFHWAFFQVIGVPYAAALGLFVGIISQFVPTIGTYIAGAVPVLVALGHRSRRRALGAGLRGRLPAGRELPTRPADHCPHHGLAPCGGVRDRDRRCRPVRCGRGIVGPAGGRGDAGGRDPPTSRVTKWSKPR